MLVTVAICTWNRALLLERTLERMIDLQIPSEVKWELLVVDNNCSDNTDKVLDKFLDRLPLRKVFEEKQGHSHARNRAIKEAQGELLLWTDDDVLVDEHWIANYVQVATEFPAASFFGGNVEPWFERPCPPWMQSHLNLIGAVYAIREAPTDGTTVERSYLPFGANMAFRTEALREFPFNPEYGRVASSLRSGDETDVLYRMMDSSKHGIWVRSASVKHFIPAQRMNCRYVYRWFRGLEESNCDLDADARFPRWRLRGYLSAMVKCLWHAGAKDEIWLRALIDCGKHHGAIKNWYMTAWRTKAVNG